MKRELREAIKRLEDSVEYVCERTSSTQFAQLIADIRTVLRYAKGAKK